MSGDVQPRKRKDKKRKKDDSTAEQIPSQPQTPSSTNQNEDVNIHVHKEDGTGGGICAKIIFFLLFSALAILIGLIITEHRGLTDLDTVDQESRFSQIFEGWTDNSLSHDEHEDEDHIVDSLEEEDHGDDADSHEEEEEEEEHEPDEEEQEPSDEVAQTEEEEDEEEQEPSEETPLTEEDEEEEEEEDDKGTAEDEEEEEEDEETAEDEEEEPNVSETEEPNVSEVDDDDVSEAKDIDDDDDDEEEEEEDEPASQDIEDEGQDDEDKIASTEADEEQEAASDEENAAEQSEEAKEEEQQLSKEVEEEPPEEEKHEEQDDQQNSKMVVKIGVGVALLVVAHVVLVRKWKSATPDPPKKDEPIPDLSRRNTIVVPPTFQEVEHDIEDVEEDYSDEDGEVESDEDRREPKSAKIRYQELRTTYTRSLTPESEPEYQNKPADDDEEYEDEEDEEVEEEEEEESDGGEYEKEDEDDDLLKRLEARYGKLRRDNEDKEDEDEQFSSWKRVNVRGDNEAEESDSDRQSDAETYEYENITNKDDLKIKEKLDEAHKNIQNNTAYAIKLFDVLLQNYPSSPRSLYGKAQALDLLADQRRSNDILQKAISVYLQILTIENVPDALFEAAADRCINRMRFMGNYKGAIDVHHKLINRFPEDTKHKNQLVVSYLTINRVNKARLLLEDILSKSPDDGFALVHYGFILKTVDNNLNDSVSYLQKGISTKAPGVIDGRFYFHLGDALARLGRTDEAMKVYEDGVKHNLFLSKYQRSLYNVDRLKGQPWWKKEETPYSNLFAALESNWKKIREEGISVLNKNGQFQSESENLKDTGDWKQFELFARGQKNVNNCKKCPVTCKIIESVPDAKGCRRGQTKFSVMHPGTHVWPHCGPTNCRLRVHLGLKVPPHTYIRVADEIRSWNDGEVFIFDDSFEHEVWHNGTSFRLVLIVDVWHPELTAVEKRTLSPI